jgi:cephalosporin-C deacetylase-like acetyl esterase
MATRRDVRLLGAIFFVIFVCFAAVRCAAAPQALADVYAYDHAAPLNARVDTAAESGAYTVYHVAFDSVNGERVPGDLYMPPGEGARPCVIIQHGYGGDKSMAAMFAALFAPEGYAVMAIDAQYHGARRQEGKDVLSTDAADNERAFRQSILDLMRTVDYLETRDDIDTGRMGFVGMSMGSFFGAVFTGVDKRVNTAVLIVGGGDWAQFMETSQVPPVVGIRGFCEQTGAPLAGFSDAMSTVEPLSFIDGLSPRPLLMINCSDDIFVPAPTAQALFDAAGEPKYLEWLKCGGGVGHIPPVAKTRSMLKKWFNKQFSQ